MLTCINNSRLYTHQTPKFHHNKVFESAMLDKFKITSCKYLDIILIKIVGYTIAILILSGALGSCINSSGKAALFQTPSSRWKVNHKNSLKDPGLWPTIFKTKWKCFTVKVSGLPIDLRNPRNFSTSNDLPFTVSYSWIVSSYHDNRSALGHSHPFCRWQVSYKASEHREKL